MRENFYFGNFNVGNNGGRQCVRKLKIYPLNIFINFVGSVNDNFNKGIPVPCGALP